MHFRTMFSLPVFSTIIDIIVLFIYLLCKLTWQLKSCKIPGSDSAVQKCELPFYFGKFVNYIFADYIVDRKLKKIYFCERFLSRGTVCNCRAGFPRNPVGASVWCFPSVSMNNVDYCK